EARRLDPDHIGTEHLLLGVVAEDGDAAGALADLGLDLETARREVEDAVGRGAATPSGHVPFSPRAKKALESSLREARDDGHDHIGPEHILQIVRGACTGRLYYVIATHEAAPEALR